MKIISEGHGEDWSLKIKCECVMDNFGFSYDSDKEHCGSILEIDKDDVITREWFKYPNLEGTDYVVVCPRCQCCLYLNPSLLHYQIGLSQVARKDILRKLQKKRMNN